MSNSNPRERLCRQMFDTYWFPAFHEPVPRYHAFRVYSQITRSYFTGNYPPRMFTETYIRSVHPRFLFVKSER
jgi:hypothetical protein